MLTLEQLRETYFSDRPVTQIFFGEPYAPRIVEPVLAETDLNPIDPELDVEILQSIAAGQYPVLVLMYDEFSFDRHVSEDAMRTYLRERNSRPDPRVFASAGPHGIHVEFFLRFIPRIGPRPCTLKGVGRDLKYYFAANPGEHLVIATIGREPVPGTPVET
ncbi:hypothetical protein KJ781_02350 [Patescibacteria group bacterium]|nr:hypothetical protein [Patescibacteria group bacterium]MBU1448394.1 hypothetical protein [Patescibacteria group bacterium]MBU2613178.1 hypothetical protein [Patescibacteria group bacterium]